MLAYAAGAVRPPRHRARGEPPATLTKDAFDFLADLRTNNTTGWMDSNRARYHRTLRDPFRALMEYVATRYVRDIDPEINAEVKAGQVMASIKKRFPDEEGDYYPYYWGAFSRGSVSVTETLPLTTPQTDRCPAVRLHRARRAAFWLWLRSVAGRVARVTPVKPAAPNHDGVGVAEPGP